MSDNIKTIVQSIELDFLIRNAAMKQDGNTKRYALPVMWQSIGADPLLVEMHPTPLQNANEYIKITIENKGGISDGYHTFDDLYEHRIVNYIALCRKLSMSLNHDVWISKNHSDGNEWKGWFLLGIGKEPGKQITYHLPEQYWEEVKQFAEILLIAPQFDGHTSSDVLERIGRL